VPGPLIAAGTAHVLFAYDVGLGIRLPEAARLLSGWTPGATGERATPPRYLDFKVSPLRVVQRCDPVAVASLATAPEVEAVVFDFGAISISYRLPLRGPLSDLVPLSSALYENAVLLADSRGRVSSLLESIAPAVHRPGIAGFVEDYAVFQIASLDGSRPAEPGKAIAANRSVLAQILRSETRALSAQEVEDALGSRIAYGADDEAIIDWNGSILFHEDAGDVLTVLEYANVALLEMRWLDDQLDLALDRSHEALAKGSERRWRRSFPLAPHRELRGIARLQTDSAMLLEGVTNALKFVGDPYLARLYRLAARRMHLEDWDASITRKLQLVESIYQKLSDQASTRRMEALEWVIIVLIAASIVLAFL
jgi:hypothetical protein